jgi:pimeloyl-ACP methyl ester carboxylesterase
MKHTAHVSSADGTRIGYEVSGGGPGLVIVSGALLGGSDYRRLAALLSESFTVYAVDRRGRGASGAQGDAYSIGKECEDLMAVLRQSGARLVFGHSYGGLVTLQTALQPQARHLLDKIALFEPAVSIDGSLPAWFLPAFSQAVAEGRLARAMALLTKGLQIGGPLGKLPLPPLTVLSSILLATAGRPFRKTLPTVPAEAAAGIALDGPADTYADIAAHTLLLVGERGPVYLREAATTLAHTIPGACLTSLPSLNHGAPQQAPQPIAAELRAFFTNSTPDPDSMTIKAYQ